MVGEGDSSLLEEQDSISNMLLNVASQDICPLGWFHLLRMIWPGWTLLGLKKEEKDQHRVTRIPRSTHVGRYGGSGLGDTEEEEGRGGCNHNHSDVEGVPKEDSAKPAPKSKFT